MYISRPKRREQPAHSVTPTQEQKQPDISPDDVDMIGRRILSVVASSISACLTHSSPLETRPHAEEVVEWLREQSLISFAPILVGSGLDSLHLISKMTKADVQQICREHDEIFPFRGGQTTIGNVILITKAIGDLAADPRALHMQARLDGFVDRGAGMAGSWRRRRPGD